MLKLVQVRGVKTGALQPAQTIKRWSWEDLAGRFVEVHGDSVLTVAAGLVVEAQLRSEPVGWVTFADTSFFPPDFEASGIDLGALVVVRVGDAKAGARAVNRLTCCGAFGLVVYDMGDAAWMPTHVQGRLITAAKRSHTALVCLTDRGRKTDGSPNAWSGSMVSLRAQALRVRGREGRFGYKVNVEKDKRGGPGWSHEHSVREPIA